MINKPNLREIISLRPQFLRSVHLERDFYAKDAVDGYLVTRGSLSALSLLARGITDPTYRAQSISGPYGAGKSALAMYFARLLDEDKATYNGFRERQSNYLGKIGSELIPPDKQGYLTVLATGTRESLSTCLVNSIRHSLNASGHQKLLKKIFPKSISANVYNTRQVVKIFEDLSKLAVTEGALGLIVIVDELGKLLEYAALNPDESDIHLLQELAEAASRSHQYPFWFITILQQDFSNYASRLGKRHQREWEKIQQRFFDVPCLLDDTDAVQLVASALNSSSKPIIANNKWIRKVINSCKSLAPKGFESDFKLWCKASYPIHPTSLVVMPALFRRFGQNERSLFSFLSTNEVFSLIEWLRENEFNEDNPPFIGLPQLLDYTSYTLIGGRPSLYSVRVWTEVEDALGRLGEAPQIERSILKCIGLLGLLGDASPLTASKDAIQLALESPSNSRNEIENALKSLEDKKLIVFRRFRNAYRLWEGSDIDIGERLTEAYQTLPLQSGSIAVARDLCPRAPLVARRHSFNTGMLRFFTVAPNNLDGLQQANIKEMRGDCDGVVIHCLVTSNHESEMAASHATQLTDSSVIVVIGKESEELTEAAKDVTALEWIRKNTPSLASDRIARQELNERRLEAETAFRIEWSNIFDPGRETFTCYWKGSKYTGLTKRTFSSLLSDACDATFPYAPVVKNELINRRQLSSAAAAARRNLLEAMISNSAIAQLGISGYPPERSIYESFLLQSGMHKETNQQIWSLCRPDDPGLVKAWDYIEFTLGSNELKPKSIAELFKELSRPPYGLANGFLPILLCAFLTSNSSTIAVYEEGVFVPELSVAVMDRLIRKNDRFSIVSFKLGGERSMVVDRFAKGFNVDNGVLPVVRSLYARIHSLPIYTLNTKRLSPGAMSVRDTILKSKSPERLLFIELPGALGYEPFSLIAGEVNKLDRVDAFFASLNSVFAELINCYTELLERIKEGLLVIFDIPSNNINWREIISHTATNLYEHTVDSKLRTLLLRARETQLDNEAYLESIGGGVINQIPNRWGRNDEDNFARLVPELASKFRGVEAAQDLKSVLQDEEEGYLFTVNGRNGKTIRRIVRFSKSEQDEVKRISSLLSKHTSKKDKRIVLAALIDVASKMTEYNTAPYEKGVENEK